MYNVYDAIHVLYKGTNQAFCSSIQFSLCLGYLCYSRNFNDNHFSVFFQDKLLFNINPRKLKTAFVKFGCDH